MVPLLCTAGTLFRRDLVTPGHRKSQVKRDSSFWPRTTEKHSSVMLISIESKRLSSSGIRTRVFSSSSYSASRFSRCVAHLPCGSGETRHAVNLVHGPSTGEIISRVTGSSARRGESNSLFSPTIVRAFWTLARKDWFDDLIGKLEHS